ncbi:hypothetical protein M514_07658 [Trichuris suis]|uniref:Uncharacterized protein n=1 Tax=Trichuris suis TaxID=68888 RepID=A0A085M2J9_9BILA|nr:hypothetical protein M513_07658 [Trichuris suis]KFD65772.1 hypothetical protein M514_07658 [Trichuris suis]
MWAQALFATQKLKLNASVCKFIADKKECNRYRKDKHSETSLQSDRSDLISEKKMWQRVLQLGNEYPVIIFG